MAEWAPGKAPAGQCNREANVARHVSSPGSCMHLGDRCRLYDPHVNPS